MPTLLQSLREQSVVVADTGDLDAIRNYRPTDATTNPTLILKATQSSAGQPILDRVLQQHAKASTDDVLNHLLVAFGCEILSIIPGRVSTEVDARYSFDTRASIERARQLIALYEAAGVARERVLIKIASTWEGIAAARVLQAEGIRCNMTLLFSLVQAAACAEAGVQLISPFVGRIYDWYKKQQGSAWSETDNAGLNDPGVQSVTRIYQYYRHFGISTEIMGASFRNTGQILALAGCDLLTISPQLLEELSSTTGTVKRVLDDIAPGNGQDQPQAPARVATDEASFRFALNEDAMATEKLAEGIRSFAADARQLEEVIRNSRR